MNTCSTCYWWSEQPGRTSLCGRRTCLNPAVIGCDPGTRGALDQAHVIGGDGLLSGFALRTGPDFGCVQWEAKP